MVFIYHEWNNKFNKQPILLEYVLTGFKYHV